MADIVDGRCHAKKAPDSPPLIQHGNLVFQAHHVGWIITGTFAMISIVTSFWLINKHLQWYTNKKEQRYIVRILFMVPIYSVVSFASYLFWNGLSRENDREARRKGEKIQRWMFPLSSIKSKPADGLYFLQMMKWGVLQYCVIRPTTTLAAVILDYIGLYCEDSWSPKWGHVYITVIISISVSISMYCLLQLYMPVRQYLVVHKPILKLFAIKAVVFLTFWQATFLSLLTMFNVVKDTKYMTADNINIGIGAILETFEMALFAFLHIRAFTYRPYKTPPDRTPRWRSLVHAMNFAETFRELWAGAIYMFNRYRGRENDMQARRDAALEGVFGRSRYEIAQKQQKRSQYDEKTQGSVAVSVDVDEVVHVGEERQWLGAGDSYAYGLKYQSRKEKSDSLGTQIERELEMRGYTRPERSKNGYSYNPIGNLDLDPAPRGQNQRHSRGQRSWWRNAFARISQSGSEPVYDDEDIAAATAARQSNRRASWIRRSRQFSPPAMDSVPQDFEDPPPPSVIRSYRRSPDRAVAHPELTAPVIDVTAPLFIPQPPTSAELASPQIPPAPPRNFKRKPPSQVLPSSSSDTKLLVPTARPHVHRVDSLLGRVFPASDASHSARSGPTSSHSHQSAVRLGGAAAVEVSGTVTAQAPLLVDPGAAKLQSQERLVEIPQPAFPPSLSSPAYVGNTSAPSGPRSKKRRSSHIRDSAQYQEPGQRKLPSPQGRPRSGSGSTDPDLRRSSRVSTIPRTAHPADPHSQRRERIVLPSPLAPVAIPSSPPRGAFDSAPLTMSPTALSSPPRSPHDHSDNTVQPAQLRRSTYNAKRYSYGQGQGSRSSRDRAERRVSAPPEGGTVQMNTPMPDYELGYVRAPTTGSHLRSVAEDGRERR
ncbi:hypothetical protein EIP91_006762 [Steccherinum ochraceum]|uniref:DUF300-domain-containing protein n=1 Tax=Steccherinum ochraceum TaxID=92696 RepID=A0A4R0RB14_9APHY|nr:hypothetical protein EIP91_006762 [Steccherinum ochraceum]